MQLILRIHNILMLPNSHKTIYEYLIITHQNASSVKKTKCITYRSICKTYIEKMGVMRNMFVFVPVFKYT